MKEFSSILVVIPYRASPPTLQHLVHNSMVLGQWMGCEVHFLADLLETPSVEKQITQFKRKHPWTPQTLIIQPKADHPTDSILETIATYSCSLVVQSDSKVLHPTEGTDEKRLLEHSSIPVLLLPRDYDFQKRPPREFLVPLSGEEKTSEALTVSLKLADQTHSSVDFLHIVAPNEPCSCAQALESLGDELYHEYRQMADKVISEASPYSTPQQRKHIRHFFHCTGFTGPEITKLLSASPGAILVLEWKGTLAVGHAEIIKDLLRNNYSPVLFVRKVQEKKSTLRVGRKLRAS